MINATTLPPESVPIVEADVAQFVDLGPEHQLFKRGKLPWFVFIFAKKVTDC